MDSSCLTFLTSFPISLVASKRVRYRNVALCCAQQQGRNHHSQSRRNRNKRKRSLRRAATDACPISEVSVGDQFIGTICDVGPANSSWVEIGVATSTGKAVRARMRFSTDEKKAEVTDIVGGIVPVYVHKLDRQAARIEVRKGSLPPKNDDDLSGESRMLDSVAVAEELLGRVIAVGPYGAVIDVNVFRKGKRGRLVPSTGLLPRKYFRETWASDADLLVRDDVEKKLSVGDDVTVWVRVVRPQSGFLMLDSVPVSLEELKDDREKNAAFRRRLRRAAPDTLVIGERRFGTVREFAKFGLFVDIGVKTDGLVHYSEMGARHRSDWRESIDSGARVVVEVLSVSGNRIGLRLLFVGDEETEENNAILSQASSAVARFADVEKADLLKKSVVDSRKKTSQNPSAADDTTSGSKLDVTTEGLNDLVSPETDNGHIDEEVEDEEDEGEEAEKFSDEYFEDKYGF